MESNEGTRQLLRELLNGQKLAMLSTHSADCSPDPSRLVRRIRPATSAPGT
jgi:hypothetical protein